MLGPDDQVENSVDRRPVLGRGTIGHRGTGSVVNTAKEDGAGDQWEGR